MEPISARTSMALKACPAFPGRFLTICAVVTWPGPVGSTELPVDDAHVRPACQRQLHFPDRVGERLAAHLPHHRTYRSVSGGSQRVREPPVFGDDAHKSEVVACRTRGAAPSPATPEPRPRLVLRVPRSYDAPCALFRRCRRRRPAQGRTRRSPWLRLSDPSNASRRFSPLVFGPSSPCAGGYYGLC